MRTADPTPDEILKRRAEIHRLRQEHADAEAILATPAHEHLIPEDEQGEPEFHTIYEMGLPGRVAAALERYGVIFAGELCGYSAERLRLINDLGEGSIQVIRQSLARLGLALRVQAPGERTLPLPRPFSPPRTKRPTNHLSSRQVDHVFALIASGVSQREIARRLYICRWTVWNQLRMFKEKVRSLFQLGAAAHQVEARLGRDRWQVWLKSLAWDERNERIRLSRAKPASR